MSRPPFPPFTAETAAQKVRMAEDGWNSRNPSAVSLGLYGGQPLEKPGRIHPGAAPTSWRS